MKRRPLEAKGTSRASNSSASHPAPTPSTSRPPLNTSMEAASLARMTGWRNGSTRTAVPIAARCVAVAITASAIMASK